MRLSYLILVLVFAGILMVIGSKVVDKAEHIAQDRQDTWEEQMKRALKND